MSKLSPDELKAKALASLDEMTPEELTRIQAGIDADPDNPELTDADFARMRPASPELIAAAKRGRGQRGLQKTPTKVKINVRLDADLLERLRSSGDGWQGRINTAVREYLAKTGT